MKRISNINTISALIDRLITERIKLYFFKIHGEDDDKRIPLQKIMITNIKRELERELCRTYKSGKYKYHKEFRTFNEQKFVDDISELVFMDARIGEADRARLSEVKAEVPDFYRMAFNEMRLRMANETRARLKNEIDENLNTDK